VTFNPSLASEESIQTLSEGSKLPGLSPPELTLLRKKQSQLKATASSLLNNLHPSSHILNALSSTLIFAQHEAGTVVCIDPRGYLLTCSHCIAETAEEWSVPGDAHKRKWLLYYTGLAVRVECRAWDPKRDLALLKVITIERPASKDRKNGIPSFTFAPLATRPPATKERIMCIGQPGRDDLESTGNKRTKYNLVEVSEGQLRGMIPDVDPQDNSEIGTLKHNAWTYWGHSGAPLLRRTDGALVGLHSSWDDQTAMRHGIPWVAIEGFLREHLPDAAAISTLVPAKAASDRGGQDVSKVGALLGKDVESEALESGANREKSKIELVDLTASSP
jgi:Trypsin-like peptidase domain